MAFWANLDVYGERTAIHDAGAGSTHTYAQLKDAVNRRAGELAAPSKSLVFCFCRTDIRTVIDYLGALKAGHAVALLDARLPAQQREPLIELYSPEFVCDPGGITRKSTHCPPVNPCLSQLLTTSGSTGNPKLVRLSARNIQSNAESIGLAIGITDQDRAIASLPLHYSYGLSVLNSHLAAGASIVLTSEGLTSARFWQTVREHRCTSFAGVPYSYQILDRLGLTKLDVPSLVTLTQAGGKLSNELIPRFHELMARRNGRFFVMYGQTEATARIAVLPPDRLAAKPESVGLPVPGGSFHIEDGEIVYEGPNVMLGYAENRSDLALGDQLQGRLATGDRGRLDSEGFLYVDGRARREAKVFGVRLSLDDVENALRDTTPKAAVSAGSRVLVFCESGDAAEHAAWSRQLCGMFRIHQSAFEFRRIDCLPMLSNGKIDYLALQAEAAR